MEAKIIKEEKSPLFARKEVILEVQAETNPSKEDATKLVAEMFKADIEAVQFGKVESKFGSKTFKIYADVYDSKAEKDKTVVLTKKQREELKKAEEERLKAEAEAKKQAEEEAKAAEEAKKAEAEKPAEETPAEEPKEEEKTE